MYGFTTKTYSAVSAVFSVRGLRRSCPPDSCATGRWDFYYTLTSVALLSIASAGVWLTFYIGRINIGQGAFALIGRLCLGHSGHQGGLVVLAVAARWPGFSAAARGNPDRPADPAAARRLLRDGHAGSDPGGDADSAGAADHQWRQGHRPRSRCPGRFRFSA